MKATNARPERQRLFWSCECGKELSAWLNHYDVAVCGCGRKWWALQPKRDGGLKIFPWPGTSAMAREQQKQEGQDVAPNYMERRDKWVAEIRQ